jgi:hypothetical protein
MHYFRLLFLFFVLAIGRDLQAQMAPGRPTSPVLEVAFRAEVSVYWNAAIGLTLNQAGKAVSADCRQVLSDLAAQGAHWRPSLGTDMEHLLLLQSTAEIRLGRTVAPLANFVLLRLPNTDSLAVVAERLNTLPEVWYAAPLPVPLPPPSAPNFQPDQGYLLDAPDGIAGITLWDIPGGNGAPDSGAAVKVCDIEFSWNLDHVDLPPVTTLVPSGMAVWSPLADDNHGTAVLGQLASKRDTLGTTGIVYAADFYVAPSGLDSVWQLGAAIVEALTVLGEGDVLVIEHEMTGPTGAAVPIEWWPSWYAAVVTAIGNGVHVVEAAGNGGVDLDDPVFSIGNFGHWPFLAENNSGAVIVGAGAAPPAYGGSDTARARLGFSNYGSRVDLQGWGEQVATTGFGYAYPLEGKNVWYTKTFSGTSSATPIVAGAVAALESIYREAGNGEHLAPGILRNLLVATGSAQQNGLHPTSEKIGPLPNIQAAYADLPIVCCIGTTGNTDCDPAEIISLTDLTRLVNFLFVTFEPLCCTAEGNINNDPDGLINLSDLTLLTNHLFITFEPLPTCP